MKRLHLTVAVSAVIALSMGASASAVAPSIIASPQGSSAISVSWTGSLTYELQVKLGGASGTVVQTSSGTGSGPVSFTGLINGTTYTVVMKDTSDNSTTSATVTPEVDRPSAPTNLDVTSPCALTLKATWDAPVDPGSLGVRSYVATASIAGVEVDRKTLSQLENVFEVFQSPTSLVEVRVFAVDDLGQSPNFASVQAKPDSSVACAQPAGESDSSPDSGAGGGGGGGVPAVGGEALPGVPKSLAGSDRVATSIAVAEADFTPVDTNPTAQSNLRAKAAVVASSASFPDALAAGPLAYSKVAPLFLTGKSSLDSRVSTSMTKLVPAGSTVYLVGGESAVSASVASSISGLGFTVQRLAGMDRYETAVKVAQALGNPNKAFAATGLDFPDALSAGIVAAREGGSILLTRGSAIPASVGGYLLENPGVVVSAVGGPAAAAFPSATKYVGVDRFETAVKLAEAFPPTSVTAGVASGLNYPDGLVSAPYLARRGGVLLLTRQLVVPSATANYIKATTKIDVLQVFGGLSVVSDTARRTLATYL